MFNKFNYKNNRLRVMSLIVVFIIIVLFRMNVNSNDKEKVCGEYRPMITFGQSLYFDTNKAKAKLSEEWVVVGTIKEICSATQPIKYEDGCFIANDFTVGTKIYAKENNLDILYVPYKDRFIEYMLQDK